MRALEGCRWHHACMGETQENLAERIRARGLPEIVVRIALEGGEAVSPVLDYRARAVWPEVAEAVMDQTDEDLVPLWVCDTTHAFAGEGRYLFWSPEADEPWDVYDTFAGLVRTLLTDLYEDDDEDEQVEERERVAHLLLPPDQAAEALVPEER